MSTAGFEDDFYESLEHIEICESCEEDIGEDDTVMLFTWNPSDKSISPLDRNMKWDTMISKYLKGLHRCCKKFCVVPEVSEMGRLHCHGWFIIKDKVKWVKSVLPKLQRHGMFKMNKMNSKKGLAYYKKDYEVTNELLRMSLPFCHYTVNSYMKYLRKEYLKKVEKHKNVDITSFFDWE